MMKMDVFTGKSERSLAWGERQRLWIQIFVGRQALRSEALLDRRKEIKGPAIMFLFHSMS